MLTFFIFKARTNGVALQTRLAINITDNDFVTGIYFLTVETMNTENMRYSIEIYERLNSIRERLNSTWV